MKLVVNGESKEFASEITLINLLDELKLDGRLAVEINQEIIPKSQYSERLLREGDKIEIVHAIGGG